VQPKLALLGLTLVAVALALWFVLTHGTEGTRVVEHPSDPVAAQPSSSVVADVDKPARASESPVAAVASPRLRVRSSAGIPLAFVEIEHEGSWVRHALVEGALEGLDEKLPTLLRAPGHVARPLDAAQGELVLEPDALLIIEGEQLRSCLEQIAIEEGSCRRLEDWRAARERAIVCGWISDTSFGLAFACDRLEPLPPEPQVELLRADRQRSYLILHPKSGMRERWQLPCDGIRAGSALEILVQRPHGIRGPVTVQLDCRAENTARLQMRTYAWGGVVGSASDLSEECTIPADEEVARFPFALRGRLHVATALDQNSHAYGGIEFTHDGSSRVLVLNEGFEFRGRIVEAESRRPLRSVHLLYVGVESRSWTIEAQDLKLEADGGFVLRGPTRASVWRPDSPDPPKSFALVAQAPGFDDGRFLVERTQANVLDAGEIALVRHKNPVVLAPGHAVSPRDLDGQCLVFADKPEELWRTLTGVALEDGRLEIEFSASGGLKATPLVTHGSLLSGAEESGPFDRALGTTLLVHVVDDVRTFRLGSDGLYHRVPEDSLELTLRTEAHPADGNSWKIGWTWDGAWIGVGQLASGVVGNEKQARITVPHGAQQLWWSSTGIPPDLHGDPGGFQAISGSSMKVVLR
jgi:hypothetical protein